VRILLSNKIIFHFDSSFFLILKKGLLLDVCNYKDQQLALNIHAFLGGLGASLGYFLTAIDWKSTFHINYGKTSILILHNFKIF
jgi:hypothetical protein